MTPALWALIEIVLYPALVFGGFIGACYAVKYGGALVLEGMFVAGAWLFRPGHHGEQWDEYKTTTPTNPSSPRRF